MIEDQHAIQMVNFVLDACREQPGRSDGMPVPVQIRIINADVGRPADSETNSRNGKAPFVCFSASFRTTCDLWIDEYVRRLAALCARSTGYDHTLQLPDLDSREPDPS